MEFWEREAYDIAYKITGGNPLYRDLVPHIYLLLSKLDIRESDLPRVFARWGWNQYTWKESKFNQLYRGSIYLSEGYDKIDNSMMYQESKYQQILDQFMDDNSENDQILFCKEITKMHLCGMTYREIRSLTGISLDTIHKAIKKFKNDLNNFACLNWTSESSPEFSSPQH